jgi:hypothetical protein
MVGLGPYRPIKDLERALDRGDLQMAIAAAKDCRREYGHPINLDIAVRFLPLLATDPTSYNTWACRWLSRWLTETPAPTIEQTAELAGCLESLASEPDTLGVILGMLR